MQKAADEDGRGGSATKGWELYVIIASVIAIIVLCIICYCCCCKKSKCQLGLAFLARLHFFKLKTPIFPYQSQRTTSAARVEAKAANRTAESRA